MFFYCRSVSGLYMAIVSLSAIIIKLSKRKGRVGEKALVSILHNKAQILNWLTAPLWLVQEDKIWDKNNVYTSKDGDCRHCMRRCEWVA